MEKLRIAIPTKKRSGLEDIVSEVFGKTKTFTIVDVENSEVRKVQVIDNPEAGTWYILVDGYQVQRGRDPYVLEVTLE